MNKNCLLYWIFAVDDMLTYQGYEYTYEGFTQEMFDDCKAPAWVFPAYKKAVKEYLELKTSQMHNS